MKVLNDIFNIDIFDHIFIDTITACNRRCFYCPNSKFERGLKKNLKIMDLKLFYKIIDELSEVGWKGEIAPNFYGEPLLDTRLVDLIKYARNKVTNSVIILYTNGDLLTVDLYKKLVSAGTNRFIITQHPTAEPPFIKDVLKYRKDYSDENVEVVYKKLVKMYNREGVIAVNDTGNKVCINQALRKIGVHWDGSVIFCCNDYFVKIPLGNIRNERLMDVWNMPYYKQLREDIKRGLFKHEICINCKFGSLQNCLIKEN